MECSACGTELHPFETHCPFCGKPAAHYHRQRRCLHCGTPAAERAETCLMCGKPVDSLPLRTSFTGSWVGVALGVMVIVGLVMWVNTYQSLYGKTVQAAPPTPSPTATATRPATPTPTMTPTPQPTVTVVEIVPTPTPRTHVVEAGQTLYYIARQYQVSVEELMALNNLSDSRVLRVGQVLIVPDSAITWIVESDDQRPPQVVHVIRAGETLSGLSFEYDTPIDAIVAANPDINLDLIYEGQEIIIPLAMPTATPTPTAPPTVTPTATPRYVPPALLLPPAGQISRDPSLFFNWTATGWLADDEFYVLHLTWPDGSTKEYWTKSNSWRIDKPERPQAGPATWRVKIMRQTGINAEGTPAGIVLADSGKERIVTWR